MKLAGWGNFPVADARLSTPRDARDAASLPAAHPSLIARGNGRAYGDAAVNPDMTVSMLGMDRIRAFDRAEGRLVAESGLLLTDLLALVVPAGWFPPVTPGTKLVTLGGMVAADVHGKNHHVDGTLGRHIERLELLLADGTTVSCSRDERPELFRATLGGMGLTGIILSVALRLRPIETAWIRQETLRARDLDELMGRLSESQAWTYTVAWIDCLARGSRAGRGILYRGEHARLDELSDTARAAPLSAPCRRALALPCYLPGGLLRGPVVRAMNAVHYHRARPGTVLVDYDAFFYPLDRVHHWNRVYGRRGFAQYQCVLPLADSRRGIRALLGRIARAGRGSFLAVLKLMGPAAGGMSFPMEGYTLALDFPATPANLALMDELDVITAAHGGRLYLAKDARAAPATIAHGYPALDDFRRLRAETGAAGRFQSMMSRRLGL